ncbi:MAG TPA: EAL domain-containing protein [Steroidobacteraceae bacterium]|nr:EAL domain-containing protein [Steroidobacteraceae bacterium]
MANPNRHQWPSEQGLDDTAAVPVLVQSVSRNHVEMLNSLLRNAGLAAHCTWIPAVQDIADALEQLNPELLVCIEPTDKDLKAMASVRDLVASAVPLVVVRDQPSGAAAGEDMANGARDTVALGSVTHLTGVLRRELRAFRMERTLTTTLRSAQDYRQKLETVLRRSNDAIAQVQEGIVVQVNDSWLELFGYAEPSALIGQPVMDLFTPESQAPLKGALAACLLGRWSDHLLKVDALVGDGSTVPLELVLDASEYDGEPCVQLIVPVFKRDDKQLATELADAVCRDATTGLWLRRHLLRLCGERLAKPPAGGVRCFALVRIDRFDLLSRDIGVRGAEELLALFPAQIRAMLGPHDIAGHFGAASLLLLLERGNARDAEAWSESLVERVGKHAFPVGERRVSISCTVGLALVANSDPNLDAAINDAQESARRGAERGGNRVVAKERVDQDARVLAYDQVWVKHIKAALTENRFHLVQQPIASLSGGTQKMFDVAMRMLDTQGREVLPSEFLPAAERNDLMRPIDRWVLGAALASIAKRQPDQLFVRLSRDSALDTTLMEWLDAQLKTTLAEPQRLCLQVTEAVAENNMPAMHQLQTDLAKRRVKFALEHFGGGRDSAGLIGVLPVDFLKIDGSLMQGLTGDPKLQQRVRAIVDTATKRNVKTVAERIEDANTMAVVWQLGVQFIQGYFVHAPEEVVLKS